MRTRFHCPKICLITAIATLSAGNPALAARLLTATVELDGRLVLQTAYSDSGDAGPERVWRYFAEEPAFTENANIEADSADPRQGHVKGAIVLRIRHADRTVVEAETEELTLVRSGAASDGWHLPPREVERIARANGIGRPTMILSYSGLWQWLAGGAALLVVAALLALCGWVTLRYVTSKRSPSLGN